MIGLYYIKNVRTEEFYGLYSGFGYFTKEISEAMAFSSREDAIRRMKEDCCDGAVMYLEIIKVYITG